MVFTRFGWSASCRNVVGYIWLIVLFRAIVCQSTEIVLPDRPTDQEKQFLTVVERAVATTNIAALTELDLVTGISKAALAALNGPFYKSMIERGCTRLTLQRVNAGTSGTERWVLIVSHPPTAVGRSEVTTVRAVLSDSKIRFTNSEVEK